MIEGEVLHRDSLGSEQVIRPGQVNLMTAGHGSHILNSRWANRGDCMPHNYGLRYRPNMPTWHRVSIIIPTCRSGRIAA